MSQNLSTRFQKRKKKMLSKFGINTSEKRTKALDAFVAIIALSLVTGIIFGVIFPDYIDESCHTEHEIVTGEEITTNTQVQPPCIDCLSLELSGRKWFFQEEKQLKPNIEPGDNVSVQYCSWKKDSEPVIRKIEKVAK
jgi:hypothetical protein